MEICPNCGLNCPPGTASCPRCGASLPTPPQPAMPPTPPYQPPASPYHPPRPAQAPGFLPRPLPPPPVLPRKSFTWADVCTVLGFVASIVGYFWASVFLLPLGLVCSILGFRGDKTRGLAVAGIVISAIGLLIRLMVILNETGVLPPWITNGIW